MGTTCFGEEPAKWRSDDLNLARKFQKRLSFLENPKRVNVKPVPREKAHLLAKVRALQVLLPETLSWNEALLKCHVRRLKLCS